MSEVGTLSFDLFCLLPLPKKCHDIICGTVVSSVNFDCIQVKDGREAGFGTLVSKIDMPSKAGCLQFDHLQKHLRYSLNDQNRVSP